MNEKKRVSSLGRVGFLNSLFSAAQTDDGGGGRDGQQSDSVGGYCRAFDVAPAIPASGASSASSFKEVQVDLPFLGDIIALHVLDLFSRYFLLVPIRSKNPEGVWDTFCASRIAVFGEPRINQMDEGGEWGNDLRADRYVMLQYQGAGAPPWILERRNGPARCCGLLWLER